jgi:hypothetical protein
MWAGGDHCCWGIGVWNASEQRKDGTIIWGLQMRLSI